MYSTKSKPLTIEEVERLKKAYDSLVARRKLNKPKPTKEEPNTMQLIKNFLASSTPMRLRPSKMFIKRKEQNV